MNDKVVVESISSEVIYFWWNELDGDALVENGKVVDVQINHPGVDLTSYAEKKIRRELQEWLDNSV